MVDDGADDSRIERLLEQILESGGSPEEACRSCPDLLPQVRAGLRQLRQLEDQVGALFPPSHHSGTERLNLSLPNELPVVPGYEVIGILGRGGMGIVFRARHLRLKRPVALKMILAGTLALPSQRQRFLREAEAVAALSHPNIVRVYNAGEVDGRPWFTMELIEGGSLAQKINGVPRPFAESAALVASIAEGIAVAHRHGIIHRDLKPGNILLTADGTPKVTDFGLARWSHDTETTLTGSPVGTPSYMAPEQARGTSREIGAATDVYALGAILYELLTGRPPFKAESSPATLQQVLASDPVPPARLNARVPRDLETICLKCLHKEPPRRYASADELTADLGRFLRHEPIRARRVGIAGRTWRWAWRHPAPAAMTAALVLMAVASVVLIVRQWRVAENARAAASQMATRLVLDRGITLCERGDIASGLLWFARGLEQAERGDETDLIPALRTNLAAWSQRLVVPRVSPHFGASVTTVAYHPDGKRLLVGRWKDAFGKKGAPGAAQVVDAETFKPLGPPMEHPGGVRAAVFSPDGARVLTGGAEGTARLWDTDTGQPLCSPVQLDGIAVEVAFAPDGKAFAIATRTSSTSGALRIWDSATVQPITPNLLREIRVGCLAFNPDGKALAAGCSRAPTTADEPESGEVRFWDTHSGQPVGPVLVQSAPVGVVAFSPDGQTFVAGTSDGLVLRWRRATWEKISPPLHHFSPIMSIAFSPDGRSLITGDGLGTRVKERESVARLWDLDSGNLLATPWVHPSDVLQISFRPDGRCFATAAADGFVRVFPLGDFQPRRWPYLEGIQAAALFSPGASAKIASGFVAAVFSPDGHQLLAGGGTPDGQEAARLVDVLTGDIRQLLPERASPQSGAANTRPTKRQMIEGVAFAADGRIALTTGDDHQMRIWDTATARPVQGPRSYGDEPIPWMVLTPDEHTLVTGARGHPIEVWDRDTGNRVAGPIVGEAYVQAMTVSPDGQTLATAGDGGIVQLWDVRTGQTRARLDPVRQTIWAMRFSPDGRTLLAGGEGTAWLFDVSTGKPSCPPLPQPATVWDARFSPDGERLLTVCSDEYRDRNPGVVQLWDARRGRPLGPPLPHRVAGLAAAFDPQGRFVATGGYDGDVRFWDAATGAPVGPALVQSGPIPAIAFVSGTNLLAAAGRDGELALWPVPQAREGSATEVRRWVESITGQQLDETNAVRDLQLQHP
jgi:WD40 repeat protein